MTLQALGSIDLGAWFGPSVRFLLALIAGDVLSGVFAAIRNGYTENGEFHPDFKLRELARFYGTTVLPYLGGYVVLSMVLKAVVPGEVFGLPLSSGVQAAAWTAIVLAVGHSLFENIKAIFKPDILNLDGPDN